VSDDEDVPIRIDFRDAATASTWMDTRRTKRPYRTQFFSSFRVAVLGWMSISLGCTDSSPSKERNVVVESAQRPQPVADAAQKPDAPSPVVPEPPVATSEELEAVRGVSVKLDRSWDAIWEVELTNKSDETILVHWDASEFITARGINAGRLILETTQPDARSQTPAVVKPGESVKASFTPDGLLAVIDDKRIPAIADGGEIRLSIWTWADLTNRTWRGRFVAPPTHYGSREKTLERAIRVRRVVVKSAPPRPTPKAFQESETSPSYSGGGCRTGCRCGNACISCAKTCRQ
jgi:hypothetical protein